MTTVFRAQVRPKPPLQFQSKVIEYIYWYVSASRHDSAGGQSLAGPRVRIVLTPLAAPDFSNETAPLGPGTIFRARSVGLFATRRRILIGMGMVFVTEDPVAIGAFHLAIVPKIKVNKRMAKGAIATITPHTVG